MAPLPPPPPPAPPPPMGGPVSAPPKFSKNEAQDRNALLSQIRGGAKLKKAAVVNDRSAPQVDGKPAKTANNSGSGPKPVSNGPGGPPMQLGGIFAGGIPKLKPTGSKLVSNGLTVSANKVNNKLTKTDESVRPLNTSSLKSSLEEKLNNSSFLHKNNSTNNSSYDNNYNQNKFNTMKPREKPSERYVTSEAHNGGGKGQAPQVPTQTLNRPNAPELPKKPPGVQRSNSQSSGRNNSNAVRRPGPPNMKPPPPPKITNGLTPQSSQQPTQLSKQLNVNRKPSFTDEKSSSSSNLSGRPDFQSLLSNLNQQFSSNSSNVSGSNTSINKPPALARIQNTVVNGISQSPTYPPPPPPVSTMPSRVNNSGPRMQKPNAPNIPMQVSKAPSNYRPPLGPPPPPPHRTTSNNSPNCPLPPPPPPSQTNVIPNPMRNGGSSGPPPPVRNTSMATTRDESSFSSRFHQFRNVYELPAPTPPSMPNKQYPSHMQQSQRRRDPPPPPPQSNGMAGHSPNLNAHNIGKKLPNPVLHIQIGSTVAQS